MYNYVDHIKSLYRERYIEFGLVRQFNEITQQDIKDFNSEFKYVIYYVLKQKPSYYFNDNIRRNTVETFDKWCSSRTEKVVIDSIMLESFFYCF